MEMTNHPEESRVPQPEVLEALLARCRPEIERLFQRHWVSAEEAEMLLDEVLASLLMRWDRTGDPAPWLLAALDKAIRSRLLVPVFGDDAPA